jgi:hypothetical protein
MVAKECQPALGGIWSSRNSPKPSRDRETMISDSRKLSLSSWPRMRGAPQVGFSVAMRKIRARISLPTYRRPPTLLALQTQVQYNRKPARCQRLTVLGVTKTRGFVHPDQHVFNAIQDSLCWVVSRLRGRLPCRASTCWRRARFSRTRSSRALKALTNHPWRCRSDMIMAEITARILSKHLRSSSSLSHLFCECTKFDEGRVSPKGVHQHIALDGFLGNAK